MKRDDEMELELRVAREVARVERLEHELQRLREENSQLRRKIEDIYASETFRLGRAILSIPRKFKLRRQAATTRSVTAAPMQAEVVQRLHAPVASAIPVQDHPRLADYRRAIAQPGPGSRRWAFAVSTTDLEAGRGDLYVAAALALALQDLDVSVEFLPPERWYEPRQGTELVIALVCEAKLQFEVYRSSVPVVAWVRNSVERWCARADLVGCQAVFASSSGASGVIASRLGREVPVLPIAVDLDLFDSADGPHNAVVSTISQFSPDNPRPVFADLLASEVDAPVALFGVHKGIDERLVPYSRGLVPFFALPGVYRHAAVVLDEPQAVNQRFGTVNSRIFETLACGALPVTTSSRGLEELGLVEVPVIDEDHDLASTVGGFLDADSRGALVARLASVVADRHSTSVRAQQLVGLLDRHQDDHRSDLAVVGLFPDYRHTNPYQTLLASGLQDVALPGVKRPIELLPATRTGGQVTLHVHWTATVLGPAKSESDAVSRVDEFLGELDELRSRGCRLIWTVHNLLPHECRHLDQERRLRQGLADRADAVHVMCRSTLALAADHYEIHDDERLHVIPHGSYVGVYGDVVDDGDARAELGLSRGRPVALYLGQIRPYKGVEDLLDAWESPSRDRAAQLVVAGNVGRFEGAAELGRRAAAVSDASDLRVIPDEELQLYLRASDVVILPHRQVLNSGALLLAHSYGLPVIAPRVGCLPSQAAEGAVRWFEPGQLSDALTDLEPMRSPDVRARAFQHALNYTSGDMAEAFAQLHASLHR